VTWTKLPAIDPIQHCNICPPRPRTIPLDAFVHPGFGVATVHAEDTPGIGQDMGENATVQDVEDYADAHGGSEHDWRLVIDAPLYEAEYQRQGEGVWVLVRRGDGFA
jgi:hypothetical protein